MEIVISLKFVKFDSNGRILIMNILKIISISETIIKKIKGFDFKTEESRAVRYIFVNRIGKKYLTFEGRFICAC